MKSSCCFSVKYIALVNTFSLYMRIFLIFSLNLFDNQFYFFLFKWIRLFYFSFSLLSKLFSTFLLTKFFYNQCIQSFLVFWYHSNKLQSSKLQTFFLCLFSFHYINGSAITRHFFHFFVFIWLFFWLFNFVLYHVFECGSKNQKKVVLLEWCYIKYGCHFCF